MKMERERERPFYVLSNDGDMSFYCSPHHVIYHWVMHDITTLAVTTLIGKKRSMSTARNVMPLPYVKGVTFQAVIRKRELLLEPYVFCGSL